jgi:hypothetical protein
MRRVIAFLLLVASVLSSGCSPKDAVDATVATPAAPRQRGKPVDRTGGRAPSYRRQSTE